MARDGLDLAEIFDQIKIGPLSRGMGFGNYHLAPCDAYRGQGEGRNGKDAPFTLRYGIIISVHGYGIGWLLQVRFFCNNLAGAC